MSPSPVDPPAVPAPRSDELLAHAAFLRRLAARLVGPDEAADVVQEAFAKALTTPPRHAALRSWLSVVVTHLARNRRRSSARRTRHEAAAARAELVDGRSEGTRALEHLELQRALADLVVALPEEQRTLLYLRYFEDQKPSTIAARLGVPLKTIESRHTRALASLRAKLDERSGGDRAAWVSAMAAWIEGPLVRPGILLAATTTAIVLACLGAWLVWSRFSGGSLQEVASGPEVAAVPAEEVPARAAQREALASVPAAPQDIVGRLEGVALAREDRQPLVGLALTLTLGDGKVELATDDQGRFRYESDVPRRLVRLELGAGARTIPVDRALGQRLEPGETIELELLAPPGATLAGTVVDENGAPVAGATVIGHCVESVYGDRRPERVFTTGADGSFVLEHFGESFRLTAEAPGLACLEGFHGKVASGTRGEALVLRMAPALTFRGEVVDAEGRPVAGAKVSGSNSSSSFTGDGTHVLGVHRLRVSSVRGSTDAAGHFELGPSAEGSMNLYASRRGFLDQSIRGDAGAWNRIVLERGHSLGGFVGDADGRPLQGAKVSLRVGAQGDGTTDESGAFRIDALEAAEGSYLLATMPGFAIGVLQPVSVGESAPAPRLLLTPERILAGRVLDESGKPMADAELRIAGDREVVIDYVEIGERPTWEWAAGLNKTRTDEDGRFRFEQLYDGAFELHVTPAEGPAVALPFLVRSGEETLELVVTAAQRLGVVFSGRVLDGLTGRPIPSFQATLSRPSGEPERSTEDGPDGITIQTSVYTFWEGRTVSVTDENGAYRLAGHAPGRANLSFKAPGYIEAKLEPRDYSVGEVHEDVRLMPGRSLQFILDGAGRAADARLRFQDASGARVSVGSGLDFWSDSLSIRADRPTAAMLPRTPLLVTASAFGRGDFEFQLEAEREGVEPVVVRFPEEKRRSVWLQIYESEDASLTTGELDLQILREAVLDGVITTPREPVAFEFFGPGDKLHCRAQLTPLDGEGYQRVVSYSDGQNASWSESEGDATVQFSVPDSVRKATVVSPGCRPLILDLDQPGPWPERPEFRLIVLERLE